jgi:hypothetical protein
VDFTYEMGGLDAKNGVLRYFYIGNGQNLIGNGCFLIGNGCFYIGNGGF